jgi:hypothetical protein
VEALNVTTNCFDFSNLDPQQDFVIVVHNAHPDHNFTPADLFIVLDENFDNDTDDILDNQNNHDNQSDDDDDNWWDNIIDWWKDDDKEESKPQNLPSNWNQEHVEISRRRYQLRLIRNHYCQTWLLVFVWPLLCKTKVRARL